jgi:hypothetical protein
MTGDDVRAARARMRDFRGGVVDLGGGRHALQVARRAYSVGPETVAVVVGTYAPARREWTSPTGAVRVCLSWAEAVGLALEAAFAGRKATGYTRPEDARPADKLGRPRPGKYKAGGRVVRSPHGMRG